jgi:hypothetical protein
MFYKNNEQNNNNNIIITNNNQSIRETAQKSCGINKEDEKLQEISDIKQLTEIEEEKVKEEKEKEKQRVKLKVKNTHKKVQIVENNSDLKDNDKKEDSKIRGKSANARDIHKLINDKEHAKFQRNNRKSATLINNKTILHEKLHSVEMKIPVMHETLITHKFGNPDKYYKKIKDLGSGSYGNVYKAKNLVMDNIVAIKVIEKV